MKEFFIEMRDAEDGAARQGRADPPEAAKSGHGNV
jgi:hypothetical protein